MGVCFGCVRIWGQGVCVCVCVSTAAGLVSRELQDNETLWGKQLPNTSAPLNHFTNSRHSSLPSMPCFVSSLPAGINKCSVERSLQTRDSTTHTHTLERIFRNCKENKHDYDLARSHTDGFYLEFQEKEPFLRPSHTLLWCWTHTHTHVVHMPAGRWCVWASVPETDQGVKYPHQTMWYTRQNHIK